MKIEHTPGPWCVEMGHDGAFKVENGWIDARFTVADRAPVPFRADESTGNGFLIALAPTAPHDCSVPGCPGPENKRRLEAFEELVVALRAVADAFSQPKADEEAEHNAIRHAYELARAALAKAEKP